MGAGGRTVVPATAGREVGLGFVRGTEVRTVVMGLGVAAAADDGTAVSSGGAVTEPSVETEASVENKERSIVVVDEVVVDTTSNCRAFRGPESEQPTIEIAAARSPSRRRSARGITAEYSPLSPRLPVPLVTTPGSWASRHPTSRR